MTSCPDNGIPPVKPYIPGNAVRRLACDAMLLCAAVILSYVESFVPLVFIVPIPGIKLGLANIAVIIAAYDLGGTGSGISDAAIISVTRIFIMALLFGTATSFWFSLVGGAVSFVMLILCRLVLRSAVSFVGTSVACAAGHNAGQIFALVLIFGDMSLLTFMPWMLFVSVLTGIAVGILLYVLSDRLKVY